MYLREVHGQVCKRLLHCPKYIAEEQMSTKYMFLSPKICRFFKQKRQACALTIHFPKFTHIFQSSVSKL